MPKGNPAGYAKKAKEMAKPMPKKKPMKKKK